MAAESPKDLRERLVKLGAEVLADCLLNLSVRNSDVEAATQRLIATSTERIKRYKTQIAGVRRGKKFIDWAGARQFATRLEEILENLVDIDCAPDVGVDLTTRFFECDDNVLGRCDDSSGMIGDVFRYSACEKWVAFARLCDDKSGLVDRLEKLLESDEYGVRDSVLDRCPEYLPPEQMRSLADRFWQRHEANPDGEDQSRHWLGLVSVVAKALVDPALYEKALVTMGGGRIGGLYLSIARVYLEAGSPTGALRWLESPQGRTDYRSDDRDALLFETYGQLGSRTKQADIARRMFDRGYSVEALDRLVSVVGTDQRTALIDEAARRIAAHGLSYSGARFLLEVGCNDAADQHVLKHRAELDGDAYHTLLDLAKRLEAQELLLSTTCLYRALLDSILARAQSRYYSHGVRYWKKLDGIALRIRDWGDLEPALSYRTQLRKKHARKYAFWSKIDG